MSFHFDLTDENGPMKKLTPDELIKFKNKYENATDKLTEFDVVNFSANESLGLPESHQEITIEVDENSSIFHNFEVFDNDFNLSSSERLVA
ncbi:hypothetical protein [Secundilactobacillus kimchicus]|uniref:hypothetical protein n=1 Tax=Secundilactobacillus kimchicus TaxID=528209 RepID=UPI0024A82D99|nr:hypothetical protein [Secundilactobacillus kimchicus]